MVTLRQILKSKTSRLKDGADQGICNLSDMEELHRDQSWIDSKEMRRMQWEYHIVMCKINKELWKIGIDPYKVPDVEEGSYWSGSDSRSVCMWKEAKIKKTMKKKGNLIWLTMSLGVAIAFQFTAAAEVIASDGVGFYLAMTLLTLAPVAFTTYFTIKEW